MLKSPCKPNWHGYVLCEAEALIPQQPYSSILKRNHIQQIYTRKDAHLILNQHYNS